MGACKHYRRLLIEKLFGEISAEDLRHVDAHLQGCKRCSKELTEMQQTLGVMKQKARSQPEPEFWKSYWIRLKARMAREMDYATRPERAPTLISKGLRKGWAPAIKLAGVVAVLGIGIFIGRFLIVSHQSETSRGVKIQVDSKEAAEIRNIDYRTARYLERSKILLLGLVNAELPELQQSEFDLPLHREASRELVREAAFLKNNLETDRQRRLAKLIEELEIILLEIANMEEEEDVPGIEMLKSNIDRKGILMKINIQEMNTQTFGSDIFQGSIEQNNHLNL